MNVLEQYPYWASIALMMIGFYGVINGGNLIKKLIGMAIFQVSVLLFYISMGVVEGGEMPILKDSATLYVNPLPHVLMLTAIVVGIATQAVGLAIIVRIKERYGTIEEEEILAMDATSKSRKASSPFHLSLEGRGRLAVAPKERRRAGEGVDRKKPATLPRPRSRASDPSPQGRGGVRASSLKKKR